MQKSYEYTYCADSVDRAIMHGGYNGQQDPFYNTIGYEPNVGNNMRVSRSNSGLQTMPRRMVSNEKVEKIPDSQIQVLPSFSYEPALRQEFIDAFCRMIRGIRGRFLMANEMQMNPNHVSGQVAHRQEPIEQSFFSPRAQKLIDGPSRAQGFASVCQGEIPPYRGSEMKSQIPSSAWRAQMPRPDNLHGTDPWQMMAGQAPGMMHRHLPGRQFSPAGAAHSAGQAQLPRSDLHGTDPWQTSKQAPGIVL